MYNIGIDLGGTGIKTGVVDESFRIIGRGEAATRVPRPGDEIMDDIALACKMAAEDAGLSLDQIDNFGIGSPGTVNVTTGILEFAGNLQLHNYPMQEALSKRLGKKVFIENDANAAAFGEALAGAAKGWRNSVCITLGTGVGGGVIIDGRIFAGANYAGAELGHTVIVMDGVQCTCGRKGCWERYASATGLIEQTRAAMEADPKSKMWEIAGALESVNGKTAFDAMRAGDASGTAVVKKYLDYVSCGVVDMVNIFQPDILCIGGGISKEGENILGHIRDYVARERFTRYAAKQTEIVCAVLGNNAGIIGAANLYKGGLD